MVRAEEGISSSSWIMYSLYTGRIRSFGAPWKNAICCRLSAYSCYRKVVSMQERITSTRACGSNYFGTGSFMYRLTTSQIRPRQRHLLTLMQPPCWAENSSELGIYPAVDLPLIQLPEYSLLKLLAKNIINCAQRVKRDPSEIQRIAGHYRNPGMDELSEDDKLVVTGQDVFSGSFPSLSCSHLSLLVFQGNLSR